MRRIKIAKWSKPKLIVLTRNTSGEKVLYNCKVWNMSAGSGWAHSACAQGGPCPGVCGEICESMSGS